MNIYGKTIYFFCIDVHKAYTSKSNSNLELWFLAAGHLHKLFWVKQYTVLCYVAI
jgi:hypothetical protein